MSLLSEQWKPVLGFEGRYMVSSIGRVKSLDFEMINPLTPTGVSVRKGKVLQPWLETGYLRTCIHIGGVQKYKYVHRLVAEAFLGTPEGCFVVNHIDGNKDNNSIDNLEWCSQKDNVFHAKYILKKFGSNTKIVFDTAIGIYFSSAKDAYESSPKSCGIIHFRHLIKSNKSQLIYC